MYVDLLLSRNIEDTSELAKVFSPLLFLLTFNNPRETRAVVNASAGLLSSIPIMF
jgi:hypothetical protein